MYLHEEARESRFISFTFRASANDNVSKGYAAWGGRKRKMGGKGSKCSKVRGEGDEHLKYSSATQRMERSLCYAKTENEGKQERKKETARWESLKRSVASEKAVREAKRV